MNPHRTDLFIAQTEHYPEDGERLRLKLKESYENIAQNINRRDISIYDTEETPTGQQFFATTANLRNPRDTYRSVVNFGALPNATTTSVAHNISVANNTIFTRIYGVATHPTNTDPNPKSLPLPYSTETANGDIELYVTDTNVVITTSIDYSAYTTTYIILEYILNSQ